MRYIHQLVCATLLFGFAAVFASAAPLTDIFTFSIVGVPGVGTAVIAASPTPASYVPGLSFTLSNVPANYLGSTLTGDATFFAAGGAGGSGSTFAGDLLFNGAVSTPTFRNGNFVLNGYADLGDGLMPTTVNLNISQSLPSVPEPATLGLVGTAGLGLIGMVRSRRHSGPCE